MAEDAPSTEPEEPWVVVRRRLEMALPDSATEGQGDSNGGLGLDPGTTAGSSRPLLDAMPPRLTWSSPACDSRCAARTPGP